MMVSTTQERLIVSELYPGKEWKRRVSKMPDAQIHAIYMKEQVKKTAKELKEKEKNDEPF